MLCPVQKTQSQQQHQKPELETQSELSILTTLLKLSFSNIPLTCDEKSTFQKHTASPQSERKEVRTLSSLLFQEIMFSLS